MTSSDATNQNPSLPLTEHSTPSDAPTKLDEDPGLDAQLNEHDEFQQQLDHALAAARTSRGAGDKIGDFIIVKVLGAGGCGVVYLADDPILKRQVAIKLPHDSMLLNRERQDRFVQEAKIVARLHHTQIVEIFQVGGSSQVQYLVFEYCPGGALSDWLAEQKSDLLPATCAAIVLGLAQAVDYAHQQGVIHRDINPRNVLLVPSADMAQSGKAANFPFIPKLSDFGLGTWLEERGTAVQTQTGAVMGTLQYMAPEQTTSSSTTLATAVDIYALGVVLYELMLRTRPFVGKNPVETLKLIQQTDPIPPRQLRHSIPRDLETICLKCLAKSPSKRYSSAGELASELKRFLEGRPIQTRRASVFEKVIRWMSRRRIPLGIAGLFAGLITIIAYGNQWYSSQLNDVKLSEQNLIKQSTEQDTKLNQARQNALRAQRESGLQSRQAIYNAQIVSITDLAKYGNRIALQKLNELIPNSEDDPDVRGFEWYYLTHLSGGTDFATLMTLTGPEEKIEAIYRSDRGNGIFVAHGKKISEWDAQTGQQIRVVHEFDYNVLDFAISHKLQQVIVMLADPGIGEPKKITIYDMTQDGLKRVFAKSPPQMYWASRLIYNQNHQRLYTIWFPDSRYKAPCTIVRYSKGRLRMTSVKYDFPNFHPIDIQLGSHLDEFLCPGRGGVYLLPSKGEADRLLPLPLADCHFATTVSTTPDQEMMAVSTNRGDNLLYRKDPEQNWQYWKNLESPDREEVATNDVTHMRDYRNPTRFTPNGGLYSLNTLNLHLWDVKRDLILKSMPGLPGQNLRHLELHPDGRTVMWATDTTLGVWRPTHDVSIAGHSVEAWSVDFSPDGKWLATGSDDLTVKIWDIANGTHVSQLTGHIATVTQVAYSPDGALLASGSLDGTIRIWDATSGKLLRTLTPQFGQVRSLAWFKDGRRLVTSSSYRSPSQTRVTMWDSTSGEMMHQFEPFRERMQVMVTDDQRFIICAGAEGSIQVLDADQKSLLQRNPPLGNPRSLKLLDQQRLITGDHDGVIRIRDIASGNLIRDFVGHTDAILALSISPDGRTLASGGVDKTVKLWNLATGARLLEFKDQATQINSLAFSPDGTILASGGHDGSVKLRHAPRTSLVASDSKHFKIKASSSSK